MSSNFATWSRELPAVDGRAHVGTAVYARNRLALRPANANWRTTQRDIELLMARCGAKSGDGSPLVGEDAGSGGGDGDGVLAVRGLAPDAVRSVQPSGSWM